MRWGLHHTDWKKWRTFKGNEVLIPGDFDPIIDEKGNLTIKLEYLSADDKECTIF